MSALTMNPLLTLVHDNVVDSAFSLVASSEVPTMPAANLRTQRRSDVWRSQVCDSVTLDFYFTEPILPNYFGLINHNISEAATVRLQLHTSNDFSGTTLVDEIIAMGAGIYGFGDGGFGEHGFGGTEGSPANALLSRTLTPPWSYFFAPPAEATPYCRITITDPYNPDGFLQVGRLYVSTFVQFSRNYQWGSQVECIDPSKIVETDNGERWSIKRTKLFQRSVTLGSIQTTERYSALMNFWLQVGMTDFFILIVDPSTPLSRALTSHYCALAEDPQITEKYVDQNDVVLKFKEVR